MLKQHIDSKYNIEEILEKEEFIFIKKLIYFINESFQKNPIYDEMKKAPPILLIEFKIYAEVLLTKDDIDCLILVLLSMKQLIPNHTQKTIIKKIIKKLKEA